MEQTASEGSGKEAVPLQLARSSPPTAGRFKGMFSCEKSLLVKHKACCKNILISGKSAL